MYLNFHGFNKEPFHITPDPAFLFLSESHKEALSAIIYGVQQGKGFVTLIGEVGTGKTTVLRAYLAQLNRKENRYIYLFDPTLSFNSILHLLLDEFEITAHPKKISASLALLQEALISEYREGRNVVLLIDEAQNMPVKTLENLRMLSNLETTQKKLIQIILVGQPELDDKLGCYELRQLKQRIAVRAYIRNLSHHDSLAYIQHRLEEAGCPDSKVFTRAATELIVAHSRGNPRTINILCDNALVAAYGMQRKPVNIEIVRAVIADFRGIKRLVRIKWAIAASLVAIAGAIIFFSLFAPNDGTARIALAGSYNHLPVIANIHSEKPAGIPVRSETLSDSEPRSDVQKSCETVQADCPGKKEASFSLAEIIPSYEVHQPAEMENVHLPEKGSETRGFFSLAELLSKSRIIEPEDAESLFLPPEKSEWSLSFNPEDFLLANTMNEPVGIASMLLKKDEMGNRPVVVIERSEEAGMTKNQQEVLSSSESLEYKSDPQTSPISCNITVKPGDTLTHLIESVHGTCNNALLKQVKSQNPHIIDPDRIVVGQKLRFSAIPPKGKTKALATLH